MNNLNLVGGKYTANKKIKYATKTKFENYFLDYKSDGEYANFFKVLWFYKINHNSSNKKQLNKND